MMAKQNISNELCKYYEEYSGEKPLDIVLLPQSGSNRQYYRLKTSKTTVIGTFNNDVKENIAFFKFTEHFQHLHFPVPEIFYINKTKEYYFQSDLGDVSLFNIINQEKRDDSFWKNLIYLYKKVLDWLPQFQINGFKSFDFSNAYPRSAFDKQSMQWDLNYFKYYFLKLSQTQFDEQLLEDDFHQLIDFLLEAENNFFMYRDFQSRNIMMVDENPYFIDYQGGRKGALHYDIASLLYDAKADLLPSIRLELLDYYVEQVNRYIYIDKKQFLLHFYSFVLIRILQAMGAYGFRGFYEKKPLFLQSIPYAIANIQWLVENTPVANQYPYLCKVLLNFQADKFVNNKKISQDKLTVIIQSFSYLKGLLQDESQHGGGYIFDCRALPNPGKFTQFQSLTGKDAAVIDFLQKEQEVDDFLKHVFALIDASVQKYLQRNFNYLSVAFGCTGGQHRSVYCAEQLSNFLKSKYDINVRVIHREQPQFNI